MKTKLRAILGDGHKDIDVSFSEFPDKDTYCNIEQTSNIRGNHILILHELYPNQNQQIMKLILLIDLLEDLGAKTISVFTQYLPYARQDKRHLPGEAVSADTLSKLFCRANVTALYTFDCHFMEGQPAVTHQGLKIFNVSLGPYLLDHFTAKMRDKKYEVIGPDKGSNYLVRAHGSKSMRKERGEYKDTVMSTKHRDVATIEHQHVLINEKIVIIIDDMISTGGTLLRAIEGLRQRGVNEIYCLAVHGLFLDDSYVKIQKKADGIMVSDTLIHKASTPLVEKVLSQKVIPMWEQNIKVQ